MKIKEIINEEEQLNELNSLINFIGSIAKKYHSTVGSYEINAATNRNMATLSRVMGRYKVDWSTITMFVLYYFLRTGMLIDDEDIYDIINDVMHKPDLSPGEIQMSSIQDNRKKILISSLITGTKVTPKLVHDVVEEIIAAATLRYAERQKESEHGMTRQNNGYQAPNQTTAAPETTAQSPEEILKSKVDEILSANGVNGIDAAIEFLNSEKAKLSKSSNTKNQLTASDGKSYTLSIGADKSRIWLDQNGYEAPDEIHDELEQKAKTKKRKVKSP